jgi:hypothetical protein
MMDPVRIDRSQDHSLLLAMFSHAGAIQIKLRIAPNMLDKLPGADAAFMNGRRAVGRRRVAC